MCERMEGSDGFTDFDSEKSVRKVPKSPNILEPSTSSLANCFHPSSHSQQAGAVELSYDIFTVIIFFVENNSEIRAMSLVCRKFRNLSQNRLFKQVHIRLHHRLHLFIASVQQAPHLLMHISLFSMTWVCEACGCIRTLLWLLTGLENLRCIYFYVPTDMVPQKILSVRSLADFAHQTPGCHTYSIQGMHDVPSSIWEHSKHLFLVQSTFNIPPRVFASRLQSLALHHVDTAPSLMGLALSGTEFSSLTHLYVSWLPHSAEDMDMTRAVSRFLATAGSLKLLTVVFTAGKWDIHESFHYLIINPGSFTDAQLLALIDPFFSELNKFSALHPWQLSLEWRCARTNVATFCDQCSEMVETTTAMCSLSFFDNITVCFIHAPRGMERTLLKIARDKIILENHSFRVDRQLYPHSRRGFPNTGVYVFRDEGARLPVRDRHERVCGLIAGHLRDSQNVRVLDDHWQDSVIRGKDLQEL